MEENFYKDEFEQFLTEQANNHRMYPSDNIWRNINKKLHGDRTWPSLTIAAFTFLAAIIAVSVYFSPGPNIFAIKTIPVKPDVTPKPATALLSSVSNNTEKKEAKWNYHQPNTLAPLANEDEAATPSTTDKNILHVEVKIDRMLARQLAYGPAVLKHIKNIQPASKAIVQAETIVGNKGSEVVEDAKNKTVSGLAETELPSFPKLAITHNDKEKIVLNESLPNRISKPKSSGGKLKNRFSYSVYITPSKSYRKLREDPLYQQKQVSATGGPVAINYAADVNKIVRHIPGNGVEAGIVWGYNLSKNIKVTSGFQFNVRQYYIEAFAANPEVATIALQTERGIDSINRVSVYRTLSGHTTTELVNRYYQIAFPVGVELKVLGSGDIGISVATSVQPTYTINNTAYLVSTNFKNYAQSGAMLRNWNINTSIEAFLNIKSGDYRWQLGPQFRYQQLPSFTSQYPIKENLMDYGLKIGVSKTIR